MDLLAIALTNLNIFDKTILGCNRELGLPNWTIRICIGWRGMARAALTLVDRLERHALARPDFEA